MKMSMRSKGVELTESLRRHLEDKLRFALARFTDRVRSVRVQLTDLNGPKGGEDIRCQIQAELAPRGTLVIRETQEDPVLAFSRASERVKYSLSRHLERSHMQRRGRR